MTRVLFVLPNLQGGGAERVVLDLVRSLDHRAVQPALFLLKGEGVLRDDVPVDVTVRTGIASGRLRSHLPSVLRVLTDEARRSDVVVGALELDATYAAWVAASMTKRPLIAWVHTVLERYLSHKAGRGRKLIARFAYPQFPVTVVPSASVASELRRWPGVPSSRIIEIPNLIDIARVRRRAFEQDDSSIEAPTVVALGRLEEEKRFDILIRAHALLRRRGLDHRLIIAGEGPQRPALEALATSLEARNTIVLPGFIANPYPLLRMANLFVLSSQYEGSSLVLLEALALGVPVVATDCPVGPREILEGGRWGRLVPPNDPDALAAAIADALRDRQGNGRRRAEEFAPDRIVPQWEALLRRVIR